MRKSFIIFFSFIISVNLYSQINLYNSVTKEKLKSDDGAVVTIKGRQGYFLSFLDKFIPPNGPHEVTFTKASREISFSFPYTGETYYISNNFGVIEYTYSISSPYFETATLSKLVISDWVNGAQSYRYIGEWNQQAQPMDILKFFKIDIGDIYLIPKKKVIEGAFNINTKTETDLGLFSTLEISSALKIKESQVIDLIIQGELKGKKIGDKYFIRKDDFDEYMRK